RVMPGSGSLCRVVITEFMDSWQHSPCWQTSVVVHSNETTAATIGGSGRPVAGKIVLDRQPDVDIDWATNEPATVERWEISTNSRDKSYARYAGNLDASGKFQIPDIPAGDYRLTVPVNNPPRPNSCGAGTAIGKAEFVFTIPPIQDGRSDEPLNLGAITAELFDTL